MCSWSKRLNKETYWFQVPNLNQTPVYIILTDSNVCNVATARFEVFAMQLLCLNPYYLILHK